MDDKMILLNLIFERLIRIMELRYILILEMQ